MSSEEAKRPEPSQERPAAGRPEKKLPFFERLIQKTKKLFRQSR
jgi:hypothetical protein